MTTLDELRNELADRAREVSPSHHTDRLAGIRRKRTAHRRTTAAGVAGVTALAVAAVVSLMPGNANIVDSTPPPVNKPDKVDSEPELPGARVPVVEHKGVRFYETPGIVTLDHYVVGEPGQQRLEFSFIAGSDVLTYSSACYGVPGSDRDREDWLSSITINGHPQVGWSCSSYTDLPNGPRIGWGPSYEREAGHWKSIGVEAGARVEVVVETETSEGEPLSHPDVVQAAAFWSVPDVRSHRVNDSTVVEPVIESGGVNYRYLESVSATLKEGGSLAAPAYSEGSPVLMSWGKSGPAGTFMVDTGGPNPQSSVSDRSGGVLGGGSGELIRSGDTSRARVTAQRLRGSESVTLWIALYEPIQ